MMMFRIHCFLIYQFFLIGKSTPDGTRVIWILSKAEVENRDQMCFLFWNIFYIFIFSKWIKTNGILVIVFKINTIVILLNQNRVSHTKKNTPFLYYYIYVYISLLFFLQSRSYSNCYTVQSCNNHTMINTYICVCL